MFSLSFFLFFFLRASGVFGAHSHLRLPLLSQTGSCEIQTQVNIAHSPKNLKEQELWPVNRVQSITH